MWFPRLPSDRILRLRPVDAPFAVTLKQNNAERVYCLNAQAEKVGLHRGMSFADARAFCPDLVSHPARPDRDARFLAVLRRWATRYCPWVGLGGEDELILDISGAAHLWGGEHAMLADMRARALRGNVSLRLGCAGTRGGAWALAHHGEGVATPGQTANALAALPVAALRLPEETCISLQRLGLRTIADLQSAARAPLARRFGAGLLHRLDQALGQMPEPIMPQSDPPHYGVRLTLPDPIGLVTDVMAATERLLGALCDKFAAQEVGARHLLLTLRRVDRGNQQVELRLAAPMRDPARILPLFERGISTVEAGFGIDQVRLVACQVDTLPAQQITAATGPANPDRLSDLITRIGTRIGLENVQRFLPADSHIPERSFITAAAAYSQPENGWAAPRSRPLRLFPPEPVIGQGSHPPDHFRWRRMTLNPVRVIGPERIAPEWWLDDENWHRGVRDYWRVDTRQGRRLWLFYTPQNPGWFVQGEFA